MTDSTAERDGVAWAPLGRPPSPGCLSTCVPHGAHCAPLRPPAPSPSRQVCRGGCPPPSRAPLPPSLMAPPCAGTASRGQPRRGGGLCAGAKGAPGPRGLGGKDSQPLTGPRDEQAGEGSQDGTAPRGGCGAVTPSPGGPRRELRGGGLSTHRELLGGGRRGCRGQRALLGAPKSVPPSACHPQPGAQDRGLEGRRPGAQKDPAP